MNEEKLKRKAVEDLEEIRQSGEFNMFLERRAIMQHANRNNMFNLVSYVGNDRQKYMEVLKELG